MGIRDKLKSQDEGLPILERYEILERIDKLELDRDKAMVAFLYLTACRVSEVVRYIIEKNLKRQVVKNRKSKDGKMLDAPILKREYKGRSILKKQIEMRGNTLVISSVRSLKRRRYLPRAIPIIISKERKFVKILFDYIDPLDDEAELWPITRQRAYQILSEVGMFNHYLRHIRLTHMVTDYDFTAAELKKFVNWSSSTSADSYVHLDVKDLIAKMER